MAEPGMDPRYAAQFQRGFDPAQHAVVAPKGPMRIEVPRVAAQRVPDPPPMAVRPPVETLAVDAAPGDEIDELPVARARTEWALLVVGILLPLLGIGVWWRSVTDPRMFTGYTMSPVDQFVMLVQSYLPGPLFVAGVVAIIAWVALRAVGRAR